MSKRRDGVRIAGLLAENAAHVPTYCGAMLPISAINVVAQPRKTFENLDALALDIAKKRLLNPPTVAVFDAAACGRYLGVVNALWGTAFVIDGLHAQGNGGGTYHVLLAGERRFRSCLLLYQKGCEECREHNGDEHPGACFRRHFGGDAIEVRLCADIPPLAALFLQLSENTHMPVPPHEEANAYALLFGLIRTADGRYPMTKFAREVGRSADTIRKALRFHALPDAVQREVAAGNVAYGAAVEIARLQEAGVEPQVLHLWLKRAMVDRKSVAEFRKAVSDRLAELRSGQETLRDIFSYAQERELLVRHVRKTVSANLVQGVWSWSHYLGRLMTLFEEGKLGVEGSEYSEQSPRRIYTAFIDYLARALPYMETILSPSKAEECRQVISEACRLMEAIGVDRSNE